MWWLITLYYGALPALDSHVDKVVAGLEKLEWLEADKLRRQAAQKEASAARWQSTLHKGKGKTPWQFQGKNTQCQHGYICYAYHLDPAGCPQKR